MLVVVVLVFFSCVSNSNNQQPLINVKFVATEGLLIIAVAGLLLRGVALELTGGSGAGVVDEMRFIFLLAKPILN